MSRRSVILLSVAVAACLCRAQTDTNQLAVSVLEEFMDAGMEVAGIRAPYYDDAGVLQAELYGEQARVLEGGVVNVSNLRIDLYEDDKVTMTLFAPQCFVVPDETGERNGISAYSDEDVLISMDQITIAGRGFRFSSNSSRFEILHEAKVLLRNSSGNLQEGGQ